ncbi:hypothetical protein, partial [Alkalicoccus luteus]|uniref:hypothetical protein n=1 Tax=Alkalicoccus luteus TaxID=1237094 RepID=UPI00403402EF
AARISAIFLSFSHFIPKKSGTGHIRHRFLFQEELFRQPHLLCIGFNKSALYVAISTYAIT